MADQENFKKIAHYNNLIKLDPLQIKNYELLGDILINSGDLDGALNCYKRAVENTKHWRFYNKLARVLIEKQKFHEAAIQLNLSLKFNSCPHWWSHYLLGDVLTRTGASDLAIKCYQESINIEPTINAYRALSSIYLLQKKWSDAWNLYCQAHIIHPQRNFWGIYHQYCAEKLVALTYDDGPNPDFTPHFLTLLEKYQVKATFFLIGKNVEKYSEMAQSILLAKHELANHSYSHVNLSLEPQKVPEEIEKIEEILKKLGVKGIINFRPPFGNCSMELFQYICQKEIPLIAWNICPEDYLYQNSSQMIARKVINNVNPGSIILLHDNNLRTLEATELIIKNLLSQGYYFVTVKELINQGIANYDY